MSKIVVLLGKPGSGKDTQASFISSTFNYKIIKTGDFVRGLAKKNTKITQILQEGGLVDDELVNQYVAAEITKSPNDNYLTDGFPRDESQARWFDDFLQRQGKQVDLVLLLDLSDELAKTRLIKRGRADDQASIIDSRLDVYRSETTAVIDYYEKQNKVIKINASPDPRTINDSLREALK